jgi:glutamate--cysteine ligase
LRRRGVRYVELRSLDVNAYHPLGIEPGQMSFLKLLMLYTLLVDSPRIDATERRAIDGNLVLAAHRGREPGLRLRQGGTETSLRDWALHLVDGMIPLAELLDADGGDRYARSLEAQRRKILNPEATPSACMLEEMRAKGEGFAEFSRRLTEQHRDHFLTQPLTAERESWLSALVETSRQQTRAIEDADDIDFDEFLRRYFAQSESRPVDLPAPV